MRKAPLLPLIFALGLAGLASGCVAVFPVPLPKGQVKPAPSAPVGADACGAAGLQGLVGQPEAVLKPMRFAQPVRVVHPGQPVTMDHAATRLNIDIDAKGRISALHCG